MSTTHPTPTDATPLGHLDEGPLARILGYQLAQATIVAQRTFLSQVGSVFDLRPVEFTVLVLIDRNPDQSANQLARALAVTPPNVKVWIDRLEQRGLVERSAHAVDRRLLRLRTTAAGAALATRAVQRVCDGERASLAALTPGEQAILLELLHKVARCRGKR